MARASGLPRLRGNFRGTGESYQAVAAVGVVLVCAGLVLSASHFATENVRQEAQRQRAHAQGELFLEALLQDPAVRGQSGALSWEGALRVATGSANLEFLPPSVKVLALREAGGGGELLVVGSPDALRPGLVIVERAVLVERSDGTFAAGVARAGVDWD